MIAIVGAGLAGLAAARRLIQAGHEDFIVLDRASSPGGRVQTQMVDGFRLDAGFHVASTGYRAFRSFLPAAQLEPAWFDSGVLMQRADGVLVPLFHPFRHPVRAKRAGLPPLPLSDQLKFIALVIDSLTRKGDSWARCHKESAAELVRRRRFSESALDALIRPFFGGVFLDEELGTSSGLLHYYLRSFVLGRSFLPTGGIGQLAYRLRKDVPDSNFRFQTTVREIQRGPDGFRLALESGEILSAKAVILATSATSASKILGWPEPAMRPVTTVYFRSPRPLYHERCLVLHRGHHPLVRHFLQVTNVDPCLAPSGEHLLSATVLDCRGLGGRDLFSAALREIDGVIHGAAALLKPLHIVRIPDALPVQTPQNLSAWAQRRGNLGPGLCLAGDLAGNASQQNALETGVDAAESALAHLQEESA
jgi:phytoene dehydrogenase-like protein